MFRNLRHLERMQRTAALIFFSTLLLLTHYTSKLTNHSSSTSIQPITSCDRSLLFHINGSQKYLGRASSIYIINLPARSDRRTESIALIQTLNLEAFIIPAYSVHSPEILVRNRNRNQVFFKSTELACWASHMRTWLTIVDQSVKEKNRTWSLVFEDDIDLEVDTPSIMQTFPHSIWTDADLIYLGHCANPPGKLVYQSSKHIHRIHQALHPSCTHAYAIRSDIAKRLVSLLSRPFRPVDDSIVKLVQNGQLIAYSIHPPLAIQKPVSNSNPSNVNQINRRSLMYRIQFSIYLFLQWCHGVQPYEHLNNSVLKRSNLIKAASWRETHENGIWKNE